MTSTSSNVGLSSKCVYVDVRRDAAELERRDAALAGDFQPAVRDRLLQLEPAVEAGPLQVAVEAAAQAAIGGEHEQRGVAGPFRAFRAADGCTSRPLVEQVAARACVMRLV